MSIVSLAILIVVVAKLSQKTKLYLYHPHKLVFLYLSLKSHRCPITVVVLKTLFQFSDWIVTRYLDEPKETEFGVKNIKKNWDRAPPRP